MERKEEEEEEIVCLESFFINDNYQLTTFTFGSQVLELLCLQSASTDFDLTGQLVWPGAMLLNDYLSKNAEMLQGCSIIELGSGVGVTGILCSRYCREIVLTDHNEEVLKILKKNIELHKSFGTSNSSDCKGNKFLNVMRYSQMSCLIFFHMYTGITAEKLEWGDSDQLKQILGSHLGGFDLILGADICFQQNSVPLLFDTVEKLLRVRGKDQCKFILGYVSRAKVMDVMVVSEAVKHGLNVAEIAGSRTVIGNLGGVIYDITLH